jgi:DNA-binding NarL/FixJ family response regulator
VTLVGRALAQSAGLAAIEGKSERACRLAGAAIGVLENAGGALHETERAQMDNRLASARHQLGTASAAAALMQGKSMRPEAAVAYALEDLLTAQKPTCQPTKELLSQREMQVAQLIRDGLTNAQIGHRLIISDGTAKRHVENIMAKLQVHSRAQIVDWLTRHSASKA